MRECVEQLSLMILQVGVTDRWIWKLHSSHWYTLKGSYNLLTTFEVDVDDRFNHILWLKQIPLKVNIFIWCLFINRLATKMILFRRNILDYNDSLCTTACDIVENQGHLFFYLSYSQLWLLISGWLGFSMAIHGSLIEHLTLFGALGGFIITRKDRNRRHFHNKTEQLSSLLEKIKLQAYYWLKSYYALSSLSTWFGNWLDCCAFRL